MLNLINKRIASILAKKLTTHPGIVVRYNHDHLQKTNVGDKVNWERPQKMALCHPEKSGDLGKYEAPDPNNIMLHFQCATELNDAEPNVRNQFTLGWNSHQHTRDFYIKTLMDSVKSHRYDYKSPAALIAQVTGTIRYMQHRIYDDLVHGKERRRYKFDARQLVIARIRMLQNLREKDYKQYEWLLERLDLQFKPKPEKENEILIARKEGLRQLTKSYCDDLRNQRLAEYRTELEAQQLPFLEQKLKNLEFIRNEQIELKIDVTITQEQIDVVRKQYEELKIANTTKIVEPTKKKWKMY